MISKLPRWVWVGAAALAFSAGMVNVIALLGFAHKAATHVTGLFSTFSIAVYEGNSSEVAQLFFILLSFFLGAIVSGIVIRDGQLKMGRRYGFALFLECVFLLCATYGFVRASIWGEYFACAAAGLQNAMASTFSGTIVRTTHLTGILTDLGALTGNKLRGVAIETKRFKLLAIIAASFFIGGFIGAFAYAKLGPYAMLVPAGVIGISAIGYECFRRQKGFITKKVF